MIEKIVTLQFPGEYWETVISAFGENQFPRPMVPAGEVAPEVNKEQVTIDAILEFIRVKTKEFVKRKRTEELMKDLETKTELESKDNISAVKFVSE